MFDFDLDDIAGHVDFPGQPVECGARDGLIVGVGRIGQHHRNIQNHRLYATHAHGRPFGRNLGQIIGRNPGQRDDALAGGHSDMCCVDAGLPQKFGEHGFLKLTVCRHGGS